MNNVAINIMDNAVESCGAVKTGLTNAYAFSREKLLTRYYPYFRYGLQ